MGRRRRLLVCIIDHKIFCNVIPHAAYYARCGYNNNNNNNMSNYQTYRRVILLRCTVLNFIYFSTSTESNTQLTVCTL